MTWKSSRLALALVALAAGLMVSGCEESDTAPTLPPLFGGGDGAGDGEIDGSADGDPSADSGSNTPDPQTDGDPGDGADAGDLGDGDAGGSNDDGGLPFVPRPRPIDGGDVPAAIDGENPPFVIKPVDLEPHGYVEEEFFLQGWATKYKAEGELALEGAWTAVPDGEAPYKTRMLVRRPANAEDFNGTVFVEWLNTTGNLDAEIGWAFNSEELLRGGYGYVGVSVQLSGVDMLKSADAERYGTLQHPGDEYSYDIYAQAGAAIGWPGDVAPMGGFEVRRLIAYGESQSAMRMITFVNAVQPLTHVYDGIIIHSRAGWGAPVGTESNSLLGSGQPVRVRLDSDAKVLQFFTESEVFLALGPAYAARQPDSERLRTWEVAGTAHADQHLLGPGTDLCGQINSGPQHFVVKAALHAMHLWLKDGVAPPEGTPLEVTPAKDAIARDQYGNALGGVRTPAVDVPIAKISGEAPPLGPQCMLFGHTVPFAPEQLLELYPTHADYVDKVREAAAAAREARFILPEEEALIVSEAMAAPIPN